MDCPERIRMAQVAPLLGTSSAADEARSLLTMCSLPMNRRLQTRAKALTAPAPPAASVIVKPATARFVPTDRVVRHHQYSMKVCGQPSSL